MAKKPRILIVDDEEDIIEFLKYNLEKESFKVKSANNGTQALEKAKEFLPDLIILDIMMPGLNGIEICEKIRADKNFKDTLIVFLTARSESFTQIAALEMGGDDYIQKPIKPSVLTARIKAILRRHPSLGLSNGGTLKFGDLEINTEEFKVKVKGKKTDLAKKEFLLLLLLASKPGKVFKRNEILSRVWGTEVIVGDRTIDVHIRKLREKIGANYIKTIKGVGYKFEF